MSEKVVLGDLTFESSDDMLKRKKHAEHLTKFLYENSEINVISVNSAWGTGKTWFVRMWINYIKTHPAYKEQITPVYYNAWENDDFDNAFIPLLAELSQQTDAQFGEKYERYKQATGAVIKAGFVNVAKKLTAGIVDIQAYFDKMEEKELYDSYISQFESAKSARSDFSEALEAYATEQNKKIFIFVDELDRCRPTFAIQTLERIKHYFEVEGVQFILLLDQEQLSHSVKVLYGNGCNTAGYLRRFIDVEFNMPLPNSKRYFSNKANSQDQFYFEVSDIAQFFTLSLRDYDKLILWVKALISTPGNLVYDCSIDLRYYYAYFLLLKLKFPNVFNDVSDESSLVGLPYEKIPYAKAVDNFTKAKSDVEVVKTAFAIIKRNMGFDSINAPYPSDMTGREQEWADSDQLKDIILNGWREISFLDRFNKY